MLHSRAGYRSARPILFITHIRLATHGRSIQLCQNRTFGASGSPVLYAAAPKALKISESFNTASGSPATMVRHVDAVGEITDHLHVVLARLSSGKDIQSPTFMIAPVIRHCPHEAFNRPNMRGAPQAFGRDLGQCQRGSRGQFRARRHSRRAAKPRQPSARPVRLLLPRRGARGLCLRSPSR